MAKGRNQATKHKDPKTLMGYVSVSDNSVMEASLTISSAANRVHLNRSSVAGVDLFANNCDYCSDSDIPPVNRLCVPSDLSDKSNCVSLLSSSSSSSSSSSVPIILRGPFMSDQQDCVLSKVLKSDSDFHLSVYNYSGNK